MKYTIISILQTLAIYVIGYLLGIKFVLVTFFMATLLFIKKDIKNIRHYRLDICSLVTLSLFIAVFMFYKYINPMFMFIVFLHFNRTNKNTNDGLFFYRPKNKKSEEIDNYISKNFYELEDTFARINEFSKRYFKEISYLFHVKKLSYEQIYHKLNISTEVIRKDIVKIRMVVNERLGRNA